MHWWPVRARGSPRQDAMEVERLDVTVPQDQCRVNRAEQSEGDSKTQNWPMAEQRHVQ